MSTPADLLGAGLQGASTAQDFWQTAEKGFRTLENRQKEHEVTMHGLHVSTAGSVHASAMTANTGVVAIGTETMKNSVNLLT